MRVKKYKLIKEYPGSPKLGYIWDNSKAHILGTEIHLENYPEFWKEVVEKDYKILSFKAENSSHLFTLRENGNYFLENDCRFDPNGYFCGLSESWHLDNEYNDYEIYSVKRLSDGKIFTVGDNTKYGCIDNFYIKNNYLLATTVLESNGRYLKDLEHSKKPLFTTEDGVDIFEGDEVTSVNLNTLKIHATTPIKTGDSFKYGNYKHFSTKEAAKEYILINKPCLSINDLENIKITYGTLGDSLINEAKKLVKSKL